MQEKRNIYLLLTVKGKKLIAKNHMAFASALTLSAVIATDLYVQFTLTENIIIYCSIIFGSLLPDIDEPESYIGKRMKFISLITNSVMKHKTFTHYLITPLLIILLGMYAVDGHYGKLVVISIGIGCLLHDMGDMFTMNGIKGFFFPFFNKTNIVLAPKFLRFQTNSSTEYFVMYFIMIPINIIISVYWINL